MLQKPVGASDVLDWEGGGGPVVLFCSPVLFANESELLAEALSFYLDNLAYKDPLRQPVLSLIYHLARSSGHFASAIKELGKGVGYGT